MGSLEETRDKFTQDWKSTQEAETNAKLVIANVQSDEFTTVDNDLQFGFLQTNGTFLVKLTYKVRIGIGVTMMILHSRKYPENFGTGLS